jgi:hypothetical protein
MRLLSCRFRDHHLVLARGASGKQAEKESSDEDGRFFGEHGGMEHYIGQPAESKDTYLTI